MFFNKKPHTKNASLRTSGFEYLSSRDIYMDAACQSLRPEPVIHALENYFKTYNACGGRVKYTWGQKVDERIEETREKILQILDCPARDYDVSFTLNTTFGLNLLLQQLPKNTYKRIVTSDIEHNSVFLPTVTAAARLGIERLVLERDADGSLRYGESQLEKSVVVVNVVSNIDGRMLKNLAQLIADVHRLGGVIILDAAQAMAHHHEILTGCNADAICFSAHKMYAASLGVMVVKKQFADALELQFVGGGMVSEVKEDSFTLTPGDMSSRFEPGLQAFGEILSLHAALSWLEKVHPSGRARQEHIDSLSQKLYNGLKEIDGLRLVNTHATPVISVYSPKHDSHRLAAFLSSANIMVRSGYFCCHYYLHEKLHLPPLLRFSIGLHTTEEDVTYVIQTMQKLMKGL